VSSILADADQIDRRQAARAHLARVLAEESPSPRGETNSSDLVSGTEETIGKENGERLRGALERIGGDVRREGRVRMFRHRRVEREFCGEWIKNVEWLNGFAGSGLVWMDSTDCRERG